MAEIEQKRINSLTEYNGSITDVEIVLDKVGWVESLKIKLQNLAAKINHNLFANIQGGTVNEYYHLKQTELQDIVQALDPSTIPDNSIPVINNGIISYQNRLWHQITEFTSTPAGANTITTTTDLTGIIKKNTALKIKQGATVVYAIVVSITATTITIAGENSFNSGNAITELYIYKDIIQPFDVFLFKPDKVFNSATNTDVLKSQGNQLNLYAKVLRVLGSCEAADTGTDSTFNFNNGAGNTFTSNITFAGTNFGTVNDSGMTINPLYNNFDGNLRVDTVNSGNKDTTNGKIEIYYLPQNAY